MTWRDYDGNPGLSRTADAQIREEGDNNDAAFAILRTRRPIRTRTLKEEHERLEGIRARKARRHRLLDQ